MPRDWPDPRWPPIKPIHRAAPWILGVPIAASMAYAIWGWARGLW